MIVRIEFIEFTIDSKRFSKFYDFTKPEKIIFDFIENVSHKIPDANGEFRLICCIGKSTPILVLLGVLFRVQ